MGIHKVTNIFIGDGTALETSVSTLTPKKLGVFGNDQTALTAGQTISTSGKASIQVSETFADGTFKKSMQIRGVNITGARATSYAPAQREIWAIGYNRKTATGSIAVSASTDYQYNIRFKNDKTFYSERPEVFRYAFTSSATATQLSIATQIASGINNGGFKSLIAATVVGDGTGAYGLTGASNYGVEIVAKDIEQFLSSTYKENRVYFAVFADSTTGFSTTTTVSQLVANSYGEGTYKWAYNFENFVYQYEGLMNRRLWPVQTPELNANATPKLSAAVTTVASAANAGEDKVTLTSGTNIREGELVEINGVNYEVKFKSGNDIYLLTPLTGALSGGENTKVRYFYDVIVLQFTDTATTPGADAVSEAQKSVYIATPAIDTGGTYNSNSTEGAALLSILNPWLASVPAAPSALSM